MTSAELDAWSVGIVYGVCRIVATRGEAYPVIVAPYVRFALRVIRRRHLDAHPAAVEFAREWLAENDAPRRKGKRRKYERMSAPLA